MKADRQREWNEILRLSEAMRAAAAAAQWDEVIAAEQARRGCLEKFFAVAVAPEDVAAVREGLKHILATDAEVTTQSATARDEIAAQLRAKAQGRAAQDKYLKNSP